MDFAEVIEELPCQTYLVYGKLKRIMIISPRDLCMVTTLCKDQKTGNIFVPCATIDHPKWPEQKAPIRAVCHIAGWVLMPQHDGTTKTIYMTEIDPIGNIPKSMLKMGADV